MDDQVLVPCVLFGMFGWIAWVIFSSLRRSKIAQIQADVQKVFLSRFNPVQDLLPYVGTEAGKKFLNSMSQESEIPYAYVVSCVRWGILLIFLGVTLSVLHALKMVDRDPLVFGILAIALGVGCEVAAAVSYYIYRSLGLVE